MSLNEQAPRLRPIGLRQGLLALHRDLLTIHRYARTWAGYYPSELTNLEKLVLVLEDRRFMRHAGVDLVSVAREIGRALMFRRHGGASTIDMQFVRTATGYRRRSLSRKIYEMLLALLIQYRYSKIVILRSYLNRAFFGSRLIGADRASQTMFGTSSDELSLEQASEIAAMLVYPKPLAGGDQWLAKVRRRANYGMRIYIRYKQRFDKLPR